MKKHWFSLLLFFLTLNQGCQKSTHSASNNYSIKFNIGNTSYEADSLNVLWSQKLGSFSSRYISGIATQMFQIYADVNSFGIKDSANNGFYTLVTIQYLAGFNLTNNSSILGIYQNDTAASIKKRTGAGGDMIIYSKNDINRGQWFVDINGVLPFTITVTETNSQYISGTFEGSLCKTSYYTSSDSTITITNGSFKVPYQ